MEMRNAYKVLVQNIEQTGVAYLRYQSTDGRLLVKWILGKQWNRQGLELFYVGK
jgi:hypothetical protein